MNDMQWFVDWQKLEFEMSFKEKFSEAMLNKHKTVSLKEIAQQIHDDDPSKSWSNCYKEAKKCI